MFRGVLYKLEYVTVMLQQLLIVAAAAASTSWCGFKMSSVLDTVCLAWHRALPCNALNMLPIVCLMQPLAFL